MEIDPPPPAYTRPWLPTAPGLRLHLHPLFTALLFRPYLSCSSAQTQLRLPASPALQVHSPRRAFVHAVPPASCAPPQAHSFYVRLHFDHQDLVINAVSSKKPFPIAWLRQVPCRVPSLPFCFLGCFLHGSHIICNYLSSYLLNYLIN